MRSANFNATGFQRSTRRPLPFYYFLKGLWASRSSSYDTFVSRSKGNHDFRWEARSSVYQSSARRDPDFLSVSPLSSYTYLWLGRCILHQCRQEHRQRRHLPQKYVILGVTFQCFQGYILRFRTSLNVVIEFVLSPC